MNNKYIILIRKHADYTGILSQFLCFLGGIKYAIDHDKTPIIDMKNIQNLYSNNISHINTWECFFQQPCGYNLDSINNINTIQHLDCNKLGPRIHNKNYDLYQNTFDKYIKIQNNLFYLYKNNILDEILKNKSNKILGILARGTDYIHKKPKYHAIVPDCNMLITDAKKNLDINGFNYIYLCTEDKNIEDNFKSVFGDRLILSNQNTIEYKSKYKDKLLKYYDNVQGNIERGQRYLISVYNLCKCHKILAARTSASIFVKLCSKNEIYFYNLGYY